MEVKVMAQSAVPSPTSKTRAHFRADVAAMLDEMNRIEQRMLERDESIQTLRQETQAIKARTDERLVKLDDLMGRLSKAN
jgi:hypothetical protein